MKWRETSGEGVQAMKGWLREQADEMQLDVYVRARMWKKKNSCPGNGACAVSPTQCSGTAAILCGMWSVDWLIDGAVRRIPRKPCPIMATSRWSWTSVFFPHAEVGGEFSWMKRTGGGNLRDAALPPCAAVDGLEERKNARQSCTTSSSRSAKVHPTEAGPPPADCSPRHPDEKLKYSRKISARSCTGWIWIRIDR